MLPRLIYRLLLIVPITLSILLVTLFLFYQLPGLHVLDSRELQMGSERELILQLQLQEERNPFAHSRGLFYIGIYPGHQPVNRDRIPLMFRSAFKNLSREVGNPRVMEQYADWVGRQLDRLPAPPPGDLPVHQLVRLLRVETKAQFRSVVQSMNPNHVPPIGPQILDSLRDAETPLLRFGWNGANNIFHQYLTALVRGYPQLYTSSGEPVQYKFGRTVWWTLAYTIPALLVGWLVAYGFVLWFYDRPRWLKHIDGMALLLYSLPTFVLATLALVFLTSHRYGPISELFPFPVFSENHVDGLWTIYRYYGLHLLLPMILFGLSPMLLLFRIFHEKIREVRSSQPSFRYLRHLGLSARDFRVRYLSRYLLVAGFAVFSNLVVTLLGGSLIIEWIFNIPGMGRFLYQSIVNYDVPSTVFLIVVFTIVHQVGHILADGLIDYFNPAGRTTKGLL